MNNRVLVVGGAGYIGSHMVRALMDAKIPCAVFDNLSTGHKDFVPDGVSFIKGDLRNPQDVRRAFEEDRFDCVMHFSASCLVGESVEKPLLYYENNVMASINLFKAMLEASVRKFIFSSTCAIYGIPKRIPMAEDDPKSPVNPYGQSKLVVENILSDLSARGELHFVSLRYFNACGAHSSDGSIGERHDPETHLIPNVLRVASGRNTALTIFGEDYPTPDGTCVRDYIHVEDLAQAHLLALKSIRGGMPSTVFNLGNGDGYSVRQIIRETERITGKRIKTDVGPRRPGDPPVLVAGAEKAKKVLGWKPTKSLEEIIRTAWSWEQREACR